MWPLQGLTVFEWMVNMATYWRRFEMSAFPGLADYGGDPNNFLECVPTYTHAVPFLNAVSHLRELKLLLPAWGLSDADASVCRRTCG
jgi:hypothetical protein